MIFPKEIIPNPLITSTVEIRYASKISSEEILSVVFPKFGAVLPTIKEGPIPKEVKASDDNLKYFPDFILSNADFSMSFSNHAVSFDNVGEYKLWNNYFSFIKNQLSVFSTLGIIDNIERLGVRYASLFEATNAPSECLKAIPTLSGLNGYEEERIQSFTAFYRQGAIQIYLQLHPRATANIGSETKSGFVIDIDCFTTSVPNQIDESIFGLIDSLHTKEKDFLFNDLLKDEFLATLNIVK